MENGKWKIEMAFFHFSFSIFHFPFVIYDSELPW
jgi:hypothetical protein